jgi:hypothetical protein
MRGWPARWRLIAGSCEGYFLQLALCSPSSLGFVIETRDVSGAYFGTRPEIFRPGKKMLSDGEQNLRGD